MVKPLKIKAKKRSQGPLFSVKAWGGLRQAIFYSLPYLLTLAMVGLFLGFVVTYAVNSPTFQLTEVRILNVGSITSEQAFQFCGLRKGENLITLDLVSVQQAIRARHPEFKEVVVRRLLPNRIEVLLKRRTPVAQVDFGKFVQIDRDLVLLPGASAQPFKNLTQIKGVKIPRQGLLVGVSLNDLMAKKALTLMGILKRSSILKGHTLTGIDVSDPGNVFFIVDESIEIRIGRDHWIDRLKILEQTLRSVEFDRSKIRYIDIRFDDVVIGPK